MRRTARSVGLLNFAITAAFLMEAVGCGTGAQPHWSQIHGDMRNTSFQRVGPRSLDLSKASQFPMGDPENSSPIELPDGSIVLSATGSPNYLPTPPPSPEDRFVKLVNPKPGPAGFSPISVISDKYLPEYYVTSTADLEGNVYITYYDPSGGYGDIWKVREDGTLLWRSSTFTARPYQTPVPKLIELNGQVSIFLGVLGPTGDEIFAIDGNGNAPLEPNGGFINSCSFSLTNSGYGATAAPPGPPKPPFPEDTTLAITTDSNGTPYLIDSANNCGVSFFILDSATSYPPNWPSDLLHPRRITVADAETNLGPAAASTFTGYAIVPVSNALSAYDFVTGKKIKDWSIPINGLMPPPIGLNSALVNGNSLYVVSTTNPNINTAPSHAFGVVYSYALTFNTIYVLGSDGVYAFDTGLNLKSFVALPTVAGKPGGSMMVTSNGSLVVASRNGTTYVFPPN
jgi:hypothetical protein